MDGNYDNSNDHFEQPANAGWKNRVFFIGLFAICATALTLSLQIEETRELDIYSGRRRTVETFMGIRMHATEEVTKVAMLLASDPHDKVEWANCGFHSRNIFGGNRRIGCTSMGGVSSMMHTLEGCFETFEVPDKDAARLARAYMAGAQKHHHDRSSSVYFDMSDDFNSLTIFINDQPVETWHR